MKRLCIALLTLTVIIGSALLAAGLYMLDYSLAPDPGRANTDSCYRQLFAPSRGSTACAQTACCATPS